MDKNEKRTLLDLSGSSSLGPLKYMSGFMKTALKTKSSVFLLFIFDIYLFFFAFAITAACNSYLA